ncbi:hypothetical protein QL996_13340 [Planococcus sp. APC 4015]|nr:hypothetical protein [Planococcus sp. APC 4015]
MSNRVTRILAVVVLITSSCVFAFFVGEIARGQTDSWASPIGSALTAIAMVIVLIGLKASDQRRKRSSGQD